MSTATITTICPDWCELDHLKFLKAGGDLTDIEGHTGPSWPDVPSMDPGSFRSVSIGSGCEAGEMYVFLEAEGSPLTPERAREVASTLIEAAKWAEAHHA